MLWTTIIAALCMCGGGGGGATATAPAVRLNPPPPPPTTAPAPVFTTTSSNGVCTGAIQLLELHSPGWDTRRMAGIMYRESRCQPGADNPRSTATGLLQILASHCPWLTSELGEPCSASRLTEPDYNVRAGAALWKEQHYGAWSTS